MKTIATALAKAQAKMTKALKTSTNPHFKSKYADLGSVIDACLESLNGEGIAVIQPTGENEHGRYVKTVLVHGESGETLECTVPLILGKNDMQGYGSAVTYARRYGLMCMTGVAPDDDDGNAAAKAPQHPSWAETVVQDMGPNTTSIEKAMAIADAVVASFKRRKTVAQLNNEWDRRQDVIPKLATQHSELHKQVVVAYEEQANVITGGTE